VCLRLTGTHCLEPAGTAGNEGVQHRSGIALTESEARALRRTPESTENGREAVAQTLTRDDERRFRRAASVVGEGYGHV
jgi:hypothetical protein